MNKIVAIYIDGEEVHGQEISVVVALPSTNPDSDDDDRLHYSINSEGIVVDLDQSVDMDPKVTKTFGQTHDEFIETTMQDN